MAIEHPRRPSPPAPLPILGEGSLTHRFSTLQAIQKSDRSEGRVERNRLARLPSPSIGRGVGGEGRPAGREGHRAAHRTVLLFSFLCVLVALAACGGDSTLPGRELDAEPAPDFRLTDHAGAAVTLAEFRGRPVVLTFLYTDCPDVCPVTAQRIAQALERLGKDGGRVAVLAVSVDPDGDTPEKAAAFMERHGLTAPTHHFLVDDGELLAPVWLAYGVGATPITIAQRQPGEPAQFGRVGHTDATFLIDRNGRKRSLLRGEATADDYARGLRILMK